MKRIEQNDWFDAARVILKREGYGGITIRELCGALGVTTGSFYHHFSGRDGFVEAFFAHCLEEERSRGEGMLASGLRDLDEANARVDELFDHRLEAALRAWALFEPTAAAWVAALDRQRRELFARFYAGRAPKEAIENLIDLHLCALLGAQFLFMDAPERLKRVGAFVNAVANGHIQSLDC